MPSFQDFSGKHYLNDILTTWQPESPSLPSNTGQNRANCIFLLEDRCSPVFPRIEDFFCSKIPQYFSVHICKTSRWKTNLILYVNHYSRTVLQLPSSDSATCRGEQIQEMKKVLDVYVKSTTFNLKAYPFQWKPKLWKFKNILSNPKPLLINKDFPVTANHVSEAYYVSSCLLHSGFSLPPASPAPHPLQKLASINCVVNMVIT